MINHKNVGQLFTSQTINAVADGDFSLLHQLAAASLSPKLFPMKISDFFDIAFKNFQMNINLNIFSKTL